MGASECTRIHGRGADILGTTNHIERWRHDLGLLRDAGIHTLRYSIPWHRIEQRPGCFDFSWLDGPMRYMRAAGLEPVVDPLHHTSFPDWLEGGLGNPRLPALYERFLERFSARYDWVRDYTVINEPLPTTLFCSYTGMWYPHACSDAEFVRMLINVGRTFCRAASILRARRSDVRLVHVDTCESHTALDGWAEKWVAFANERRFLFHDLVLGRIDRHHPLATYMRTRGYTAAIENWFRDHAATFDALGLDYYCHSEMEWFTAKAAGPEIRRAVSSPRGFAAVCQDYCRRYGVPMLLSETNLRGTVHDRITWLRLMLEQYELAIDAGADLRGFCWCPSIDSTDWSNCCTRLTYVDPQGLWLLGDDRAPLAGPDSKSARLVSGPPKWAMKPWARPLPANCLKQRSRPVSTSWTRPSVTEAARR